MTRTLRLMILALLALTGTAGAVEHRLYVAEPGIRDYLEYGGHGLLVFDADHGHKFVKRIPTAGLDPKSGKPLNVKGVCASAATGKIHVSTTQQLMCLDLVTEKVLWEKRYDAGCDRMALSPDGKVIYLPSFEGPLWYVVDALTGDVIARIEPKSGAHNTIFGPDGKEVYLAGLKSPFLTVADTNWTHTAARTVGPFSAAIRPFTINGRQTLVFVNVNERLGFEVGDLKTGKKLCQVDVAGYQKGPVKRHGCPSHGIGLTPDEKELWVVDGHNKAVHIFDATVDAAEAGRDPQGPRRARLDHLQHRRPLCVSVDGRGHRRRHAQDPHHAHRRGRPPGDEREDGPDRLRGWEAGPRGLPVRDRRRRFRPVIP